MKSAKLDDMVRGWFVGAFTPTAFRTDACEVGCKRYRAEDNEEAHYHKVATEITLIIQGRVRMNTQEFGPGEIVVVEPGETIAFSALTDAVTVVIKIPGVLNDKYTQDEG